MQLYPALQPLRRSDDTGKATPKNTHSTGDLDVAKSLASIAEQIGSIVDRLSILITYRRKIMFVIQNARNDRIYATNRNIEG